MYYFSIPFQDFIKINDLIRRWEERTQNISIIRDCPGLKFHQPSMNEPRESAKNSIISQVTDHRHQVANLNFSSEYL
jgi:hypothetical protein